MKAMVRRTVGQVARSILTRMGSLVGAGGYMRDSLHVVALSLERFDKLRPRNCSRHTALLHEI